ncbi:MULTISPECIES: tetratricopeptide repeat protein [Clostridium]|uniref:tetratricopeptide repeat protein n=1 Tax=Clostridium TaxID=1485 RepID=UPI0008260779|nr:MULTISPECIES: tetratricopeptide repeat protein [Clostridium]PJI07945.1 tetratricopeptide repeat-containing protein [Clostridium sp. CT7]
MSNKYVDRQYFNIENLKYWLKKPFRVSAYFSYWWIIEERVPAWAFFAIDLILTILISLILFSLALFRELHYGIDVFKNDLATFQTIFITIFMGFGVSSALLAIPATIICATDFPLLKVFQIMPKKIHKQVRKAIKNNNSLKEKFNVHDAFEKQDEKVKPYLIMAMDCEKNGQYDEAIKMYYKVLDMDLNNGYAYGMLARLLYYLKRYREAIHVYDDLCLNLNCIDEAIAFRAYINRYNCFYRTSEYIKCGRRLSKNRFNNEAIEILFTIYEDVTCINIRLEVIMQLAYIYIETGDYEYFKGVDTFLNEVMDNAEEPENLEFANILLAKVYLVVNNREEAVNNLIKVIDIGDRYSKIISSKVEDYLKYK